MKSVICIKAGGAPYSNYIHDDDDDRKPCERLRVCLMNSHIYKNIHLDTHQIQIPILLAVRGFNYRRDILHIDSLKRVSHIMYEIVLLQ